MVYIQQFLDKPSNSQQVEVILSDQAQFLESPDKLAFLDKRGIRPDPKTLDQYALLDEFMPAKNTDDFDITKYLVKPNMAIASVTPVDGEIPTTRFGRVLEFRGENPFKLTISHHYDEQDQIDMLRFNNMSARFQSSAFKDLIFGSVESLIPRVWKLGSVLTWQALISGQIAYTDPRTGAVARMTYKTQSDLLPPPKTGASDWSQSATADGVGDLRRLNAAFYDINGFYPDVNVMSKQDCDYLLEQQSTIERARSLNIIGQAGGAGRTMIDMEIFNKMATRLDISPIRIYDAQYEIEIEPGVNIRGRYLPRGRVVSLTRTMGDRLWLPTIEKDGKAGIHTQTEELRSSPPRDRSYAVGRLIPWIRESNYISSMQVRQNAA